MQIQFDIWEKDIIRDACRALIAKCLVERDMVLHSLSVAVARHPERVRELIDVSPQFRADLIRRKERYERSTLR